MPILRKLINNTVGGELVKRNLSYSCASDFVNIVGANCVRLFITFTNIDKYRTARYNKTNLIYIGFYICFEYKIKRESGENPEQSEPLPYLPTRNIR